MDTENTQGFIGNYKILKRLGFGLVGEVWKVEDPQTNNIYAAKIFKQHSTSSYINAIQEVRLLQQLNHPNIINLVEFQQNVLFQMNNKNKEHKISIILEYANGGEMFKIIKHLQRFPTQVARFYFKQLLHAVSFMHSKNICHRDLKLENLLLDKHYNLKVADFGFGTLLSRGQLKTNLGTQTYKAPEINHGEQYEGTQVDVFAIGVILFIMVTGSYPFSFASRDDMVYKLLLINQIDSFWRQQYEWNKQKDINFDQDFKDIIVGMLHPDCQQRFTISQCLQHPWSNGETLTLEQIQQFLKEQKLKFPQRRAQTERPQQQQGQIGRFKSISSTDETNDITSIENSRKLDFTNRKLIKINEDEEELIQKLISYKKPDYLFLSLIKEIENLNWQIQLIPEDTYDLIVEVIQDEETILEMYIEFERIDNDRIYVNVMKKVGNYLDFQDFKSKIEDIVQNI